MSDAVKLNLGDDGILVATMDLPGRPMNVVGDTLMEGIAAAAEKLADPAVKGLILASGKADFCAGGDLDRMSKWTTAEEPFEASMAMKKVLRQLELLRQAGGGRDQRPRLGGGLEIALGCHARIVVDDPRLKLGQPEVKLGLLPGGGGTQRLPRLVGMQQAMQICAEGNDIAPPKALGMGLITALAKDRDDLMAQARAWIAANPKAKQPWDQPKFRSPAATRAARRGADAGHRAVDGRGQELGQLPGGDAHHEQHLRRLPARLRRRLRGGKPLFRRLRAERRPRRTSSTRCGTSSTPSRRAPRGPPAPSAAR
jgi:enoyl-CoA hydratase/carnithine racemase